MRTFCESYLLCPFSELYMMLSGKHFSRWPITKCKLLILLNGTETSFGCALISIITVTCVIQRILGRVGKTPSREEGGLERTQNLRNSLYSQWRHKCLVPPFPPPPRPPKKIIIIIKKEQTNKNDISNQTKTREVERKCKMFANLVFMIPGRRSQWRKCRKINYVFAKQNMN